MMAHRVIVTIPGDCTVEQFETILQENELKFEDTKYKSERMEKDLTVIRGKTVAILSDNEHIVGAYDHNIPDELHH